VRSSPRQLVTSASSSTASCHCRLTSLRHCGLSKRLYYQLRQLQQAVRSLSEDASKTLVQAFVSCRLDYCNSLFFGILEGLMNRLQSVRRCPAGDRYSTLRSYIASAPTTTLATSTPARRLQGGHVRPPVVVWHFAIVPGWRLPSCRRCSWAAAAFHSESNMCRDADIQHLWRQSVLGCWTRTVEQSSIAPERRWLIVQWIPAVVEDISVWTVGPRCSVNFINCAD